VPYVKLDCGILNSTLWFERDAREVFITALLMAEPYELTEPTAQIEVSSLDLTGWMVPPGWYGFVPAAGVGIIHRAGIDEARGRAALELLCAPELSSRSPEHDGRRLARVDGGYLVLNFIKYREKDATTAERSRRWRERQKARKSTVAVTRDSHPDTRDTTLKQKQKQKQEEEKNDVAAAAPWDEGVEADAPEDPLVANARWLVESYPSWFSEERHGARCHAGNLQRTFDAARELVRTWPEREHLEAMARVYLRSETLAKDLRHASRSLITFGWVASGIDAQLRGAA
jgi:hypothetical protein